MFGAVAVETSNKTLMAAMHLVAGRSNVCAVVLVSKSLESCNVTNVVEIGVAEKRGKVLLKSVVVFDMFENSSGCFGVDQVCDIPHGIKVFAIPLQGLEV